MYEEKAIELISVQEGASEDPRWNVELADAKHFKSRFFDKSKTKELLSLIGKAKAKAFYNKFSNEYTLVFPSTDPSSIEDWVNNGVQPVGLSVEYSGAITLARAFSSAASFLGSDLSFTGLSKGGGLATAAAMSVSNPEHMQAITVNPSTVSKATIARYGLQAGNPNLDIRNLVVRGEILSQARGALRALQYAGPSARALINMIGIQNSYGQTTILDAPAGSNLNSIQKHGLDTVRSVTGY